MNIGIQSNLWGTDLHGDSLPEILADIAEAGFAGVEIGAHRFENLNHPEIFLDMVEKSGLHVSGIHTVGRYSFNGDLNDTIQAANFTKALGCNYMLVSGDSRDGKTQDDLKQIANMLNRVGGICQQRGITYCYHNHAFEFTNQSREFELLCEFTDPDLVSLCLDIGWVERAGESPLKVIQNYLERIKYLHLKDVLGESFVVLGKGIVDIQSVVEFVRSHSSMYFTVELDEVVPDPLETACECREYLKGLGI